jgi:hypothetical protein
MSTTIPDLDRMLTKLSLRDKRRAFSLLAKQIARTSKSDDQAIPILDDRDRPVGFFLPLIAIDPSEFPALSADYRAEIERRFKTDEETEPVDDLIASLTSPVKAVRGARRQAKRS